MTEKKSAYFRERGASQGPQKEERNVSRSKVSSLNFEICLTSVKICPADVSITRGVFALSTPARVKREKKENQWNVEPISYYDSKRADV